MPVLSFVVTSSVFDGSHLSIVVRVFVLPGEWRLGGSGLPCSDSGAWTPTVLQSALYFFRVKKEGLEYP